MNLKRNTLLYLFVLVFLSLSLRLPGIFWGISQFDSFEPDEWQHVRIALNFINKFDSSAIGDSQLTQQWNARGFGEQIALASYPLIKIFPSYSYRLFIAVARTLSLGYSILLILLIYFFSSYLFKDEKIGFFSALFLAVSDLNVTYSHYGIPEVPHTFWFLFSTIMLFLYIKTNSSSKNILLKILIGIGLGFSLSFKFDFVPFVTFVIFLIIFKKPCGVKQKAIDFILVSIIMVATFSISWGSFFDFQDYINSFKILRAENFNVVKADNHLIYNPFLYLMAVISGTSFFLFCFSVFGIAKMIRANHNRSKHYIILIPFLIFFIIYYLGDATFVRRALVFIPLSALTGGFFLVNIKNKKIVNLIGYSAVLYTLLLTLFSQYYFINDNRYEAKSYLEQRFKNMNIAYSPYAKAAVKNLPHAVPLGKMSYNTEVVVLHETYYGRYYKYFTTPFRIPKSIDETYHGNPRDLRLIQNILFNRTNYKLDKKFEIKHPFPERAAFKYLFGTYETFLGDILIYSKVKIPRPQGGAS